MKLLITVFFTIMLLQSNAFAGNAVNGDIKSAEQNRHNNGFNCIHTGYSREVFYSAVGTQGDFEFCKNEHSRQIELKLIHRHDKGACPECCQISYEPND